MVEAVDVIAITLFQINLEICTLSDFVDTLAFFQFMLRIMKRVWPVPQWQSQFSYKVVPRKFGSHRSGGRLHAGCDLYAPLGSSILAITGGVVVSSGYFYCHTHHVTIDHGLLGVVRYGEVSPKNHLKVGDIVNAGDKVGEIGRLVGIHAHPMLHLEWYDRKVLQDRIFRPDLKPYKRSKWLKDSTSLLDSLICLRGASVCEAV